MRVESILFLKLKAFQLVADVLPADVVQAPGVVTGPDKLLPEFPAGSDGAQGDGVPNHDDDGLCPGDGSVEEFGVGQEPKVQGLLD